MSIKFTGNKTAIRRLSNLPTAHNDFTICGFAKLLTAAPSRVATIAYTQTTVGDSSETLVLGGDGTKVRGGDDYGGSYSSDVATVTAGGSSGANWFFFALVGVGTGSTGLRAYHATIGGTPTYQALNNRAGTSGFSVIQFGDLPYGTDGWFDGLLAHLKVFDRTLSDVELQAEAARGDPASSSSLISYHEFPDGLLATALAPTTGSGTFEGFTSNPTTDADMPVFTTGPTLSGADTLPQRTSTAPTVTTSALAAGYTSTAYSQTLAATGDTPLTWTVTSGALPSGLSLSTAGVISGTPSSAGTASFTVQAANAAGSNSRALQIVVTTPATTPTVTTTTLPDGQVNALYSEVLAATGTTPLTWTVSAGTLPTGLTLNATSGVISGTPVVEGASTFTVQATNGAGSDTQSLSITIEAEPILPSEDDGWTRLPRGAEVWVRVPRS